MYCIYSKEAIKSMNGNRGKLAAMAGHAYLHAYWNGQEKAHENRYKQRNLCSLYKNSGLAKKVALVVDTTEDLVNLYDEIKDEAFGVTLIEDAGLTVFDGKTTVCMGVGPVAKESVPKSIGELRVLI